MATQHKVLRGVPGWPADVNGVWVRVGGVGVFPDKVTKGDRADWLEVVAAPKPKPKPKPKTTKTTKRKTTKRKTTKRSTVKQ